MLACVYVQRRQLHHECWPGHFNLSPLSIAQSVYMNPKLQGLLWVSGVRATGSKTEMIRTPVLGNSRLRYSRGLLFFITQRAALHFDLLCGHCTVDFTLSSVQLGCYKSLSLLSFAPALNTSSLNKERKASVFNYPEASFLFLKFPSHFTSNSTS
jgi:hypothetical protein